MGFSKRRQFKAAEDVSEALGQHKMDDNEDPGKNQMQKKRALTGNVTKGEDFP